MSEQKKQVCMHFQKETPLKKNIYMDFPAEPALKRQHAGGTGPDMTQPIVNMWNADIPSLPPLDPKLVAKKPRFALSLLVPEEGCGGNDPDEGFLMKGLN